MLQQTQVDTVIPYYERFLDRYPDIETLASAELSQVLASWQGLGYYARARHLHAAAREMSRIHRGEIPRDRATLLSLPGIGTYTAAAILSIAFNQDYAAVDGNVKRILTRVLDYAGSIDQGEHKRALEECAQRLLPSGRASAFNQALMDLGATVCLPRGPRCSLCPLEDLCLAAARSSQELRPVRSARTPSPFHRLVGAIVLRQDGHWLAVRRPPTGLLGGLWEFPMTTWTEEAGRPADVLTCLLEHSLGLRVLVASEPYPVRHAYTHMRLELTSFACAPLGDPAIQPGSPWDDLAWINEADATAFALTGLTVKALRAVRGKRPSLL